MLFLRTMEFSTAVRIYWRACELAIAWQWDRMGKHWNTMHFIRWFKEVRSIYTNKPRRQMMFGLAPQ